MTKLELTTEISRMVEQIKPLWLVFIFWLEY